MEKIGKEQLAIGLLLLVPASVLKFLHISYRVA
jgi:hypothetical protein